MSSSYGENLKLSIFGQSHSAGIGMCLEGIPAGKKIDMEELKAFLARRAPGQNRYSTARKEADLPQFLGGIVGDTTCGAPIAAVIANTDTKSKDYSNLKITPRPGHADYTAEVKYFGAQDYAGGGHFSGRLTAPLCIAGGIVIQLLKQKGIEVSSRIVSIAGETDEQKMFEKIDKAKAAGDSVGGIIECTVTGIPAGVGDPMFGGMENRIAAIAFGIPAVKGIEFGAGFESARLLGSENNDEFCMEDGKVSTKTNNCGGILGGITDGMPLVFRIVIKPTPSISKVQHSVNLQTKENAELEIHGRHDPCIVPRALPCVESAAAIAVYDALLGRAKEMI